jgi:hypothetical protein
MESVRESDTVAHIGRLFRTTKGLGLGVLIAPRLLYSHDQAWRSGIAVEWMTLEG